MRVRSIRNFNPKSILKVNGNPVWDYKVIVEDLRLISEPTEGVSAEDYVLLEEILNYVGNQNFKIIDEMSDRDMQEVTEGSDNSINFIC